MVKISANLISHLSHIPLSVPLSCSCDSISHAWLPKARGLRRIVRVWDMRGGRERHEEEKRRKNVRTTDPTNLFSHSTHTDCTSCLMLSIVSVCLISHPSFSAFQRMILVPVFSCLASAVSPVCLTGLFVGSRRLVSVFRSDFSLLTSLTVTNT